MSPRQHLLSLSTDEELMRFISRGELAAFDELYARYGQRMLLYFTRMLNFNRALAEDALQDLFLKIAERPELFDTTRVFRTWIFSVASNTCKNYYRHAKVRQRHAGESEHLSETHFDGELRSTSRLDEVLFKNMLEQELMKLPPDKREAFILRFQEEKTLAEIAQIQNCPEGSVKSRLHYTLRHLEQKLKLYNPS